MDKLKIDFTGWPLDCDTSELQDAARSVQAKLGKAAREAIGEYISVMLTDGDTFASLQPDGILIQAAEFREPTREVLIPWRDSSLGLRISDIDNPAAITALFQFLRDQLDFWEVSKKDRAKLRALLK